MIPNHRTRRTKTELEALADLPWNTLAPAERRAAWAYMARPHRADRQLTGEARRVLDDQPQVSTASAFEIARHSIGHAPTPAPVPASQAPASAALATPEGVVPAAPAVSSGVGGESKGAGLVDFLDEWPVPVAKRPRVGLWDLVACELRGRPGRPGVLRTGLTRKRALEQRQRFRRSVRAFRPAGEWRFEVCADPACSGRYRVVGAWVGGVSATTAGGEE